MTSDLLAPGGPAEDLTDDDFYTADDPADYPEEGAAENPGAPGQGAPDPDAPPPPGPDAPFGWTRDKGTKEWRPKLRAGRPRAPASAEELAQQAPPPPPEPDAPPREDARPAAGGPGAPDEVTAMPAAGWIAKRVDKIYRRTGRFISLKDEEIGAAFALAGTKDDPEDVTAGEAWEALCRTNPRVRAWVLRALKGGVYWDLVMAHAPVFLAVLMKESVLKFIPFRALLERWAEPDDTAEGAELRPGDVGEMMDLAEQQARRMAQGLGLGHIPPEVMKAARAQAERQAATQGGSAVPGDATARPVPPALRRHQTTRPKSRAARRKAGAKR
jgi:hypothetical protein